MTEPKPPSRKPDPPVLVPPGEPAFSAPDRSRTRSVLVVAIGVLLCVGALAVLWLPLQPSRPEAPLPAEVTPQSGVLRAPAVDVPEAGQAIAEVTALRDAWLRQQAAAEADHIATWGGDAYRSAQAQAHDCDRLLGERQLLAAAEACEAAMTGLKALLAAKPQRVAEALAEGADRLEQGDPIAAQEAFQMVLAMDPDNAAAVAGLQRAERLPEVLRLVEAGLDKESLGEGDGALALFSEAVAIDPEFLPARSGQERLVAARTEQQFRQAVGVALQALETGRLERAGAALREARKLKPDDPVVVDLKARLGQVRLAGQVEALRREMTRLEESERWDEALEACEQAVALAPEAAFAATCRERIRPRINLDKRLQAALAQPQRLFDDDPLEEARVLLATASQMTPRGARLQTQLVTLESLIHEAEAEVEVLLRSDGLTDVAIYHVGRFGRFLEKRLVLRTGDYTVTGQRNGFHDVRTLLEVRPGKGALALTIRCEEPI